MLKERENRLLVVNTDLKNLAHNLNQDMLYEMDDDDDDELRAEQLSHGQRYIKSCYYYYY